MSAEEHNLINEFLISYNYPTQNPSLSINVLGGTVDHEISTVTERIT